LKTDRVTSEDICEVIMAQAKQDGVTESLKNFQQNLGMIKKMVRKLGTG
jgi:hypothetical protein